MVAKPDAAPEPARNTRNPRSGTVLAFDFGERRIGVAVGELQLGVAHPLDTIDTEANDERFARIETLVNEWQPVLLLVGLPLALDGTEHAMTALARRFAQRLHGRYGIETRLVDERLTSVEAEQQAREIGLDVRRARSKIDQLAAKLILDSYFSQ
ncbi:MAG TPA: Holliday junction resolvase RuvX [Burkholderiales bacterium]|nr:Holliday junction resolvase RuvX [Burkholderiales bacterium]